MKVKHIYTSILFYIPFIIISLYSCNNNLFEDQSNDYEAIYEAFCNEIDRHYSFFDYLELDWDSIKQTYQYEVSTYTNDSDLFLTFSEMLNCLNDPHTNIITPLGIGGNISYFSQFNSNETDYTLDYFSFYKRVNNCLKYGFIKDSNLGYIKIKTFEDDSDEAFFDQFDSIVNILSETKGIIIDLRSNTGGRIKNASKALKSLNDSSQIAFQYRYRNGTAHDDFSDWVDYWIEADSQYQQYTKSIAILTNRKTYSASEWFISMTSVLPNVTTIGDTTGGGSAVPLLRELPNGWILRISNTQIKLPSGHDFQFTGLYPDIPIWLTSDDYKKNVDAILEKAIDFLEK